MALSLADRGVPVVLLDAGGPLAPAEVPREESPGPVEDGAGRPYRLEAGRRQGLGGTGEAWHGQCTRLHDEDVTVRPWLSDDRAATGWPLAPQELARWYYAAEQMLEVTGRGYGPSRWADHPRLSPPAWSPDLLTHDFTEYAPRHRLGTRFAARLAADPHLQVVLRATVAAVELDPAGAVLALRVLDEAGTVHRLETGRVVLAAGAVENARLLMLSDEAGVGLGTGRAHTGRWLQDHPVVRTAEVLPASGSLQDLYTGLHRGPVHLFPKVRLAPQLQRAEGLTEATAIFVHELAPSALDAIARLRAGSESRSGDLAAVVRGAGPLLRAVWRRRVRGLSTGLRAEHVWLDLWLEQPPRAGSRVYLAPERDRHGLRRARVHWEVGESEVRTSRRLTALLGAELRRLGLAELRLLPAATDDEAWYAAVTDAFHPAGTTRMSADPTDGVVDPDLAVHGTTGLWVVGGSVFPTSGYANPTLTIVALALRLAAHLAQVPAQR